MRYKSPKLTADGVILRKNTILLIKRKNDPFKGKWALPGGYVEYGEKVEDTVVREVFEETGLKTKIHNLIGIYSDPDRDPRGHTITVAYLLNIISGELRSNDDAIDVKFFSLKNLPKLSFDHDIIIEDALRRVW
jgi:8-oxo-dGTP diphosphatase